MSTVIKIPLEITSEKDREELQRIICEGEKEDDEVLNSLLNDQFNKILGYEGGEE